MFKWWAILLILIILIFAGVSFFLKAKKESKTTVIINNHSFFATISDTKLTRTKGLSDKDKLLTGEAMLFIFPDLKKRTFWMHDMNFNLDIIFIHDQKIVDIATLQKPNNDKIPEYTSKKPANKVLEINAGLAKKYNIKIGDYVDIK